jgi:hypothetical protein
VMSRVLGVGDEMAAGRGGSAAEQPARVAKRTTRLTHVRISGATIGDALPCPS